MTSASPTPDCLLAHQPIIEDALRSSLELPTDPGLPLYRMMRYQLGWVDQTGEPRQAEHFRLLGALCMEASATAGGETEGCAEAAAAVELLGESVRTHEDMQTATQHRAGQDAAWWVWGPAQAINVGDGLHALARLTLFHMRNADTAPTSALAAIAELDAAALGYYEGQHLDLQLQERVDVTLQQYMRMARGKHGALMGGAVALGACAAGADSNAIEAWREAGVRLGTGALIASEVRAIWGGDTDVGRALNKSKLYPVAAALEMGTLAQKRQLGGYYFKRVMEPDDLIGIRGILEDVGARGKAEEAIAEARRSALESLTQAGVAHDALERWATIADAIGAV